MNMTIKEAIEKRKSVRTFDRAPLAPDVVERLRRMAGDAEAPFGAEWMIALQSGDDGGEFRPSTYGVIRGATTWFVVGHVAGDMLSALSAGYAMERIVLDCTREGLGTCWIGGTFKASSFPEARRFPDPLSLKEVVPVGRPAAKGGLLNSVMRAVAGSSKRKPMEDIFFESQPGNPLGLGNCWRQALELMRQAPSSANSQPWRAIAHPDRVDLFSVKKGDMAMVDMGIGLSHFHYGAEESGHKGEFRQLSGIPSPSDWQYITSFCSIKNSSHKEC